jgi:hypothetical protein
VDVRRERRDESFFYAVVVVVVVGWRGQGVTKPAHFKCPGN